MPSAAPAFKAAVFNQFQTLFPSPIYVTYGDPQMTQPPDIVGIGNMRVQVSDPTAGARRREELISLDLVFSVARGGADQQVATERAYYLLGVVEEWCRNGAQITWAGTVRDSMITNHELAEASYSNGVVAEIAATLVAHVRF